MTINANLRGDVKVRGMPIDEYIKRVVSSMHKEAEVESSTTFTAEPNVKNNMRTSNMGDANTNGGGGSGGTNNAELVAGAEVRQQLNAFLDERKLITITIAEMANRVQKLEDAALRDQNRPSDYACATATVTLLQERFDVHEAQLKDVKQAVEGLESRLAACTALCDQTMQEDQAHHAESVRLIQACEASMKQNMDKVEESLSASGRMINALDKRMDDFKPRRGVDQAALESYCKPLQDTIGAVADDLKKLREELTED